MKVTGVAGGRAGVAAIAGFVVHAEAGNYSLPAKYRTHARHAGSGGHRASANDDRFHPHIAQDPTCVSVIAEGSKWLRPRRLHPVLPGTTKPAQRFVS